MKKTALVAGGLALALVLTACSNDQPAGPAPSPSASAQAGGEAPLFTDIAQLADASVNKTAQTKTVKMSMETSAGGKSIKIDGQARFDGDNSAIDMTTTTEGQTTQMRLVDKGMYIKIPDAARTAAGTDKPWGKVDPNGQDPLSKSLSESINKMSEQDPKNNLNQLKTAGTITKSERVQLDGQETTHYSIDIELAKLTSKDLNGIPQAQLDQIKSKVSKYTTELWLNKDQLPVQVVIDMAPIFKAMGAPDGIIGATTVKYRDWGLPVDIQAPPADQVGELKIPTSAAKPTA